MQGSRFRALWSDWLRFLGQVGGGAVCALLSHTFFSLSCFLALPGFSFLNLSTQPVSGAWMGFLPCSWFVAATSAMGGRFELAWGRRPFLLGVGQNTGTLALPV